jgi:hypothetical protein
MLDHGRLASSSRGRARRQSHGPAGAHRAALAGETRRAPRRKGGRLPSQGGSSCARAYVRHLNQANWCPGTKYECAACHELWPSPADLDGDGCPPHTEGPQARFNTHWVHWPHPGLLASSRHQLRRPACKHARAQCVLRAGLRTTRANGCPGRKRSSRTAAPAPAPRSTSRRSRSSRRPPTPPKRKRIEHEPQTSGLSITTERHERRAARATVAARRHGRRSAQ